MEVININNILVKDYVESWEDAIYEVGKILVRNHKITLSYITRMIEAVYKFGPYMVIMPGLALVHAEPDSSVLETSISIMNLKIPVRFNSENDPVYVLLCLACKDKEEHIDMLKIIAEKLMEDGIVEKLSKCTTEEELYNLINK